MTTAQATVDVFLKAFQGLSREQQTVFLDRLLHQKRYREDLTDLATFEEREQEAGACSLQEYLAARAHRARR